MSRWRSKRTCPIHFLVAKHHLEVINVFVSPAGAWVKRLSPTVCFPHTSLLSPSSMSPHAWMSALGNIHANWWISTVMDSLNDDDEFMQHPALKTVFEPALNKASQRGALQRTSDVWVRLLQRLGSTLTSPLRVRCRAVMCRKKKTKKNKSYGSCQAAKPNQRRLNPQEFSAQRIFVVCEQTRKLDVFIQQMCYSWGAEDQLMMVSAWYWRHRGNNVNSPRSRWSPTCGQICSGSCGCSLRCLSCSLWQARKNRGEPPENQRRSWSSALLCQRNERQTKVSFTAEGLSEPSALQRWALVVKHRNYGKKNLPRVPTSPWKMWGQPPSLVYDANMHRRRGHQCFTCFHAGEVH